MGDFHLKLVKNITKTFLENYFFKQFYFILNRIAFTLKRDVKIIDRKK